MGELRSDIRELQQRIYDSLSRGEDIAHFIDGLICVNCPVGQRYQLLPMEQLFKDNSNFLEGIKMIGVALNILEKYCRHLLKPPSERSQMWRIVKFSNNIFRDRVDCIKGGREIMKLMGYTEAIQDGLQFPNSGQTDNNQLLRLLADIMCGKRELDAYLTNYHPYPERVESLLPHDTVLDVARFQKNWIQQGNLPMRKLKPLENTPSSSSSSESRLTNQQRSSSSGSSYTDSQPMKQDIPNQIQQPIRETVSESGNSNQNSSQSNKSGQVTGSSEVESPQSSIVCDICGQSVAMFMCGRCDNKQLCSACDERWHQHPKRKNHDRQKLRMSGSEQKSDEHEYLSAVESHALNPSPGSQQTQELPPEMPQETIQNRASYPTAEPALNQNLAPYTRENLNQPAYTVATSNTNTGLSSVPPAAHAPLHEEGHHLERLMSGMNTMQPAQAHTLPRISHDSNTNQNMGYGTLPRDLHSMTPPSMQRAAPGGPPTSKLLDKILAIPDMYKRKSKIEIHLETLQEEIDLIEERIQECIAQNATFYEDEEYGRLFRKKGFLQREKIELEKYEKELDEVLIQKDQMYFPPQWPLNYQHQMALSSLPIGPSVNSPSLNPPHSGMYIFVPNSYQNNQPVYGQSPPVHSGDNQNSPSINVLHTMQSPPSFYGHHPRHSLYFPPTDQSIQCTSPHNPVQNYPPAQNSPRTPKVSPQMQGNFVYANQPQTQSPKTPATQHNAEHRRSQSMFQESSGKLQARQTPPERPALPLMEERKVFQENKANESHQRHASCVSAIDQSKTVNTQQVPPPPKFHNMPVTAKTLYQNYPLPADLVAPLESPPAPIPPRIPKEPQPPVHKPKSEGYGSPWICQHCTFHNVPDTRVCAVCFKTSDNPKFIQQGGVPSGHSETDHNAINDLNKPERPPAPSVEKKQSSATGTDSEVSKIMKEASTAGNKIMQHYDEIYLEKQEAKRRFEEQQKQEKQREAENLLSPQALIEQLQRAVSRSPPSAQAGAKITTPSPANQKQEEKEKLAVPVPVSGEKEAEQAAPLSKSPRNKQGLSFTETMEKLNQQRMQELMDIEAKEVVRFFKEAEKEGFDTEEGELAVELSSGEQLLPLQWLKQIWINRVKTVTAKVAKAGADMNENEVGELSDQEAKNSLKQTKGDVQMAVNICTANRCKLYQEICKADNFPREEILQAMLIAEGKLDIALDHLNSNRLQQFIDHLWEFENGNVLADDNEQCESEAQEVSNVQDACMSVTNSVLRHGHFLEMIRNKDISSDRRSRMIMVEGKLQSWGRAETVLKILDQDVARNNLEATLEDIVEAVYNCGDRQSSLVYLQQECQCCFSYFPMSKIRTLNCPCKICFDCMKSYFELNIREKHVRNLCCPICQHPNMDNKEEADEYLGFLTMLLNTMVGPDIKEIYETKLRDWYLQKDPKFRWCAHCGNGFINIGGERNPAMQCPYCNKKTCFNCKKQWEDQHEGLTCEQYEQWKIDNDPENQAMGLAAHLAANGIDCPSCKMRFSLAKGGCMHFNCPECGHEFCSGCSQMFDSKGVCLKFKSCRGKGLHCHHPRDCFYYLRDNSVEDLQRLLKEKHVKFDTEAAGHQEDQNHCPVMELKDIHEGKKDEACGKDVTAGHAGLCVLHYKEYLVNLINKNKIDPVHIMNINEMIRLIEREEKTPPQRKPTYQESQYRKKLIQFIKEKIPLQR
ncbi:uncharacterized protein LOC134254512 isoform X1 [Saccostrea cucullata]|uniref:uncharacterized protein LOC134254512 isoform X1 n=1 Tax=Saccostrea cuccullata TaxID=36930 RepID=UPI002ED50665